MEPEKPQKELALMSPSSFELAQRMAGALSKSSIIPETYRDNIPNCLIALEMANRMNASPMMVMQNLYIVHGKPAWSGQFIIAAINSTGKFSPLRFAFHGDGDKRECVAWANELATKEKLEGPPVSIEMAKAEGWYQKNGSKWKTMPELMLRYRSATFFGRLYAPEVLMGMKEESEIIDIETTAVEIKRANVPKLKDKDLSCVKADTVPDDNGTNPTEAHSDQASRASDPPAQNPSKKKLTRKKKEQAPSSELPPNRKKLYELLDSIGVKAFDFVTVARAQEWIGSDDTWETLPEETLAQFIDPENWQVAILPELQALKK